MIFDLWLLIVGSVFIVMALTSTVLKRIPLTSSILYLVVGLVLGPVGFGLIQLTPRNNAMLIERITEIVVLISVFSSGLQLRTPLVDGRWVLPVRLAFGSMLLTVGLITLVGVVGLGLPLGAAVLLGGMLASTDPVLASDVQVEHPWDQDRLRFSLTGEAALNDGSATPFVLLGMGLLGLHEIGDFGWHWWLVDIIWGIPGGLLLGTLTGTLIGRLVIHLRREHKEAVGLDDFLSLGLIALTYGLASLVGVLGFLAVFAAGLALRRIERESNTDRAPDEIKAMVSSGEADEEIATHPEKAPTFMAETVLNFTQQFERIGEVISVMLIGGMLLLVDFNWQSLGFVALLFLVIRPISVWAGLLGSKTTILQRRLIGWFGMRGVAGIYYLTYAIDHGLPDPLAQQLTSLTLAVISVSVVVHGISVTPLMSFYGRRRKRRSERREARSRGIPSES